MKQKKTLLQLLLFMTLVLAFSADSFAATERRNLPSRIIYDSGTDHPQEVHYVYDDSGLITQSYWEEGGVTRIYDFKYVYNSDGTLKTCKVTESTRQTADGQKIINETVKYMFNEYGVLKSAKNEKGDYKLSAVPTYYTGTHDVKTLQVTEKVLWDDEWEPLLTTFSFNKNGYLTKKSNRVQKFSAAYDKKGRVTKIMNAKYTYSLEDSKIRIMKRYWASTGNYIDATVFKNWMKKDMNMDTVRSARGFYAVRTMSMKGSGDILGKESFWMGYGWK